MASQQERQELDRRAREGETVVPSGTGGKSLEAHEHLAEGRSKGGQTRKEQLGMKGYQEMGRKGQLSTGDSRAVSVQPARAFGSTGPSSEPRAEHSLSHRRQSGGERAACEGIRIDGSKFRTKS